MSVELIKYIKLRQLTSRTSSSVIHPSTSVLFKNIKRLAPIRRWRMLAKPTRVNENFAGERGHWQPVPLRGVGPRVHPGNHQLEDGLLHLPPRKVCRSSQSSFSNMTEGFSAPRRPLAGKSQSKFLVEFWLLASLTYVQSISVSGVSYQDS